MVELVVYSLKVNKEQLERAKKSFPERESYFRIACGTLLMLLLIVSSAWSSMRKTPRSGSSRAPSPPCSPNAKNRGT